MAAQGEGQTGDGLLTPIPVQPGDPVFRVVAAWSFDEEFVVRVLTRDVTLRVLFGRGQLWAYLDAERNIVGFGTLDICRDCAALADGRQHAYVPLLAVNPSMRGRGYGGAILAHLVHEAARKVAGDATLHPAVFLDV